MRPYLQEVALGIVYLFVCLSVRHLVHNYIVTHESH